ncbi:glycosyltransferase family 2 protein [Pseudoalteromonas piscicida]|uniref:glycosyltransferase family 2 protein n=1 Tax=Pseudoalteromonas piscicida TaxID=43662 RepID=UPI000A522709|nr:glycosyltransferase [Pseudoalteromonas piscicida]
MTKRIVAIDRSNMACTQRKIRFTNRALISLIVPAFNEQEVLNTVHHKLCTVIATLPEYRFELIYIDDGSTDESWKMMCQLNNSFSSVVCLQLSRNFGKEAALTAGFEYAQGDAVIPIDADLQDPPELLPKMLEVWKKGFDVVNMKRSAREGESWLKTASARCYYKLLNWVSDSPVEEDVGDFRLLDRKVVDAINMLPERNRYMKGLMSWPGFNQTTLEFKRPERVAGETKWSYLQLVKLGLSGITSFSMKPLRLATWVGCVISLYAFIFAIWVLVKTLVFGEPVPGYPSIMLTVLALGGVQLLAIGILGEYIAGLFTEAKQRPVYLLMDIKKTEAKEELQYEV